MDLREITGLLLRSTTENGRDLCWEFVPLKHIESIAWEWKILNPRRERMLFADKDGCLPTQNPLIEMRLRMKRVFLHGEIWRVVQISKMQFPTATALSPGYLLEVMRARMIPTFSCKGTSADLSTLLPGLLALSLVLKIESMAAFAKERAPHLWREAIACIETQGEESVLAAYKPLVRIIETARVEMRWPFMLCHLHADLLSKMSDEDERELARATEKLPTGAGSWIALRSELSREIVLPFPIASLTSDARRQALLQNLTLFNRRDAIISGTAALGHVIACTANAKEGLELRFIVELEIESLAHAFKTGDTLFKIPDELEDGAEIVRRFFGSDCLIPGGFWELPDSARGSKAVVAALDERWRGTDSSSSGGKKRTLTLCTEYSTDLTIAHAKALTADGFLLLTGAPTATHSIYGLHTAASCLRLFREYTAAGGKQPPAALRFAKKVGVIWAQKLGVCELAMLLNLPEIEQLILIGDPHEEGPSFTRAGGGDAFRVLVDLMQPHMAPTHESVMKRARGCVDNDPYEIVIWNPLPVDARNESGLTPLSSIGKVLKPLRKRSRVDYLFMCSSDEVCARVKASLLIGCPSFSKPIHFADSNDSAYPHPIEVFDLIDEQTLKHRDVLHPNQIARIQYPAISLAKISKKYRPKSTNRPNLPERTEHSSFVRATRTFGEGRILDLNPRDIDCAVVDASVAYGPQVCTIGKISPPLCKHIIAIVDKDCSLEALLSLTKYAASDSYDIENPPLQKDTPDPPFPVEVIAIDGASISFDGMNAFPVQRRPRSTGLRVLLQKLIE